MKKGTLGLVGLAVFLVILGFIIRIEVEQPENIRTIVDHTLRVYVAPTCFEQATLTNNLEETTLGAAKQLEYQPESACTHGALKGDMKPILLSWF